MSVVAHVKNGIVEQVSVRSPEPAEHAAWESFVKQSDPSVQLLVVDNAGIGWNLYEDGSLRPDSPYPSWVWNGDDWKSPVPRPEGGLWFWNEDEGEWIKVGGPQVTGTTL